MAEIDERLTEVEADKTEALNEIEQTYGGMIDESDQYFNDQISAVEDWGDKQAEIQNEQTEFAIQKIEQEQEWAEKDYQKEQSGAYKDWQKQSNQYGVNAEQRAAGGMSNTGYSESAQVAMYNQYQNRVATARESFVRAQTEFTNAMTEARLQNSAALAQIAADTLQKKLELSLQGFQYKNQLLLEKTAAKRQAEADYWGRYTDVLDQINTENALAETKRHNTATEKAAADALAEEKRQYDSTMAFNREQFDWQKEQANKSSSGGSGGSSGGGTSKITKKGKTTASAGGTPSSNDNKPISKTPKGKPDTSKPVGNNLEIDMNSVTALGYGPISEQKLANLVAKGYVQKYVEGGKIKFRRSPHIVERGSYTRTGGSANDIHTRK